MKQAEALIKLGSALTEEYLDVMDVDDPVEMEMAEDYTRAIEADTISEMLSILRDDLAWDLHSAMTFVIETLVEDVDEDQLYRAILGAWSS